MPPEFWRECCKAFAANALFYLVLAFVGTAVGLVSVPSGFAAVMTSQCCGGAAVFSLFAFILKKIYS